MDRQNLTLLTDLYELTMMQGYFKNKEENNMGSSSWSSTSTSCTSARRTLNTSAGSGSSKKTSFSISRTLSSREASMRSPKEL